jgi:hypothetical protein
MASLAGKGNQRRNTSCRGKLRGTTIEWFGTRPYAEAWTFVSDLKYLLQTSQRSLLVLQKSECPFVRLPNEETTGSPFEIDAAGVLGDAEMLLKALRDSQYFETLLKTGDATVKSACLKVAK